MPRIHGRQHIADMQARNRPRRATQLTAARLGRCQRDHRTMQAVFEFGCHQTDHARVPFGIEQACSHRQCAVRIQHHLGNGLLGIVGHQLLHRAALGIDFFQRAGDLARLAPVFAEQQFDAQRHVFEPAGRVQPRPQRKPDIAGAQSRHITAAGIDQGAQPDAALALAQTTQASRHQRTIIGVQRHQIGDGADCDQIQQHRQIRFDAFCKRTACAQRFSQRQQHVKDHPDPGQRLAREGVFGQIRVDDRVGRR